MERAVAHKQITKILGKKWGWHMNKGAPGAEKRQEAYLLFKKVSDRREEFGKAMQARSAELLAADPEYQRLLAGYSLARKEAEHLSGLSRHYKITVGRDEGLFFHIKAEGDSWEEIIKKLKERR
jgi:hypothetical protein